MGKTGVGQIGAVQRSLSPNPQRQKGEGGSENLANSRY